MVMLRNIYISHNTLQGWRVDARCGPVGACEPFRAAELRASLRNLIMLCNKCFPYDVAMSNDTRDGDVHLPRTVRMQSAELRKGIVKVMGRVQYGREHIEAVRYQEAQAVIVPVDWYEKACRALGEENRLPAVEEGSAGT